MPQRTFLILLSLSVFISCNNQSTNNLNSIRDTVIKRHFQTVDSSERFDTSDLNYRVLKAYVSNDTMFLIKTLLDIERYKTDQKRFGLQDSCLHQRKLQDLKVDEAYRFIYNGAFCPYEQITTISRAGDNINLNFILWQYESDSTGCRKINEFDKRLSTENWNEVKEKIEDADFWGLKRENGRQGFDGSSLTVIGFVKADTAFHRPMKYNYVYHWENTTLREPFELVTKISGNRQGCFWIK